MNRNYAFKIFLLSLLVGFFIFGCEDDHLARYEDPPWLGGSIIETLEEKGNYEILLGLMRKAEYEEPITKGLYTIFAADDEAYQSYFDEKGIASVDDISKKEAQQLFTLNLLNTPRSRQQLIYDYAWGEWQTPGSELGALLWRIPTKSESQLSKETVRYYESFKDEEIYIVGQEKFVPLITSDFFTDFNGSPDGSDYSFFFPNTTWSGTQWYNANIVEAEARASNGFIYYLDRAVPYIPSIEEYLRDSQDKYGVFYDLAQRFARYEFEGYSEDEDRKKLYSKSYEGISDFASEGGPSEGSIYERRNAYSAFIPGDDILEQYINNSLLNTFEHLDSVPEITLMFIVQSHLTNHFELPSKIERTFYNAYGDQLDIDTKVDVKNATLLSNGAFFEMNKILEPTAFTSVAGPVFFNSKYTTFLYGISESKMITSLTFPDVDVTVLAPPNDKLKEGGIRYYKNREQLERLMEDGLWKQMNEEEILDFVKNHIVLNKFTDFSGEGFVEMNSGIFIHYNNNQIEAGGNQENGSVANVIDKEDSGVNGILFHLDNAIIAPKRDAARFISENEETSEFFKLAYQAGLVDSIMDPDTEIEYARLKFLLEADYWTAFIPTNAAVEEARTNGLIPETEAELQDFIRYHFLTGNVVFDDGMKDGMLHSARVDSAGVDQVYYTPIEIINNPRSLSIVDKSGQIVNVDHNKANYLVKYGVLHKIDKVLRAE